MVNAELTCEPARQGFEKTARIVGAEAIIFAVFGEEALVFPDGNAVFAPVTAESPAGQRFAGIPLALAEMKEWPVAKRSRSCRRDPGEAALGGPMAAVGPFGGVGIVDGNEGRFAAHGEPDIPRLSHIDLVAEVRSAATVLANKVW